MESDSKRFSVVFQTSEQARWFLGATAPDLYVATVLTPATTWHFGFTACQMVTMINETGGNCEIAECRRSGREVILVQVGELFVQEWFLG
jgi:hypothetical protein